jgi:TatD DNase family protein
MNYIDFHVHIDSYDHPETILRAYEDNKIYAIFVTNLPEIFALHYPKIKNFNYVRLALGFHPQVIAQYEFNKELFDQNIKYTNYIGEVGLDVSSRNKKNVDKQFEAFAYIASHPEVKTKVFSIHSRGADADVLSILKKREIAFAVFHWFTGTPAIINEICDAGYYFSINPKMLYNEKGKIILKSIPPERILFETDGPFIQVHGSLVSPQNIPRAYKDLQNFIGISDIRTTIYENFRRLILNANLERMQALGVTPAMKTKE